MKTLLIIGAGGHGKVVADAALSAGWGEVAFLDDRGAGQVDPLGLPIVGPTHELASYSARFGSAVVAIGNAARRLELQESCERAGFVIATVIHPTAAVSRFAKLGAGSVVFAQGVVNAGASLGRACIVNSGATVDHDCELGDGVHVSPGANLAGNVRIGARTWVGIGACVRQGINIGRDSMIAAGAAVIADVPDSATFMGVPAKLRAVNDERNES
jgi:sugar O-acyltransferase (sialic acid O-acetyltransferase NeuD family)